MMDKLWLVLFVALAGFYLGYGLPVRSSPETYPLGSHESTSGWSFEVGWYPAIPALALVVTTVGLLLGCTWCFRHKDCKLFASSASNFVNQQHQLAANYPEASNNNISEDNNNGPISLREMQNIANNNATAYIVSENEERNRVNRESVVEFVPLPSGVGDPLERCADWFAGESFLRSRLQYLREIGRGWFGRVVEGEIEDEGGTSSVAVRILNQNASLEDKALFLDEAKMFRDVNHENILPLIAKCLDEDPWILMFELCPMDLQQYLISNRPKMAIMNESGVPLRLMGEVASALSYLHARGHLFRYVTTSNVLVRGHGTNVHAVLGSYVLTEPPHELQAPECRRRPPVYTTSSEIWSVGNLIWEICAWGSSPLHHPPRLPDLPCPYRNHLYQIMQLCWNSDPENRPTASQVQDLINHLYTTHIHSSDSGLDNDDFEDRWQRLKPNTIPKVDEHIAIVHAPSISNASNFTTSEQELDHPTSQDTLSLDLDTAVSRSSSIMSDKDPMSGQIKSESLTNLHGSLEDVRNIYLTHNETAALECHQGNILEDREKEQDKSDSSMDPWLKEIIAGSQDDVSYYKDVSDVIKNLDNILNSEKTSSSESSHQASPSRDNLSLDCKKEYSVPSSLVKSPGISNFQNILDGGFDTKDETCEDDEADDTIGTLSHSFERHSDTTSQHTLANLTPETPNKDLEFVNEIEYAAMHTKDLKTEKTNDTQELPNKKVETVKSEMPKLKELCEISLNSVSVLNSEKNTNKDCDNIIQENGTTDIKENQSKSVEDIATPVEQLLYDVSLIENKITDHEISNLEQSPLVTPNEIHKCDSNTVSPIKPHNVSDTKSSELLIQSERNMAASDFYELPTLSDDFKEIAPIQYKIAADNIACTEAAQQPIDIKSSDDVEGNFKTINTPLEPPEYLDILQTSNSPEKISINEEVFGSVSTISPIKSEIMSEDESTKQKLIDKKISGEFEGNLETSSSESPLQLDNFQSAVSFIKETIKLPPLSEDGKLHKFTDEDFTTEENIEVNQFLSALNEELIQESPKKDNLNNKLDLAFTDLISSDVTTSIEIGQKNFCTELTSKPILEDTIFSPMVRKVDEIVREISPTSSIVLAQDDSLLSDVEDQENHEQSDNIHEFVAEVQIESNLTSKKSLENEQLIAETEVLTPLESFQSDLKSQGRVVQQIETDTILMTNEMETSPEIVQNIVQANIEIDKNEQVKFNGSSVIRSDSDKEDNLLNQSNESTVYMDLINNTSSEILNQDNLDNEVLPSLEATALQGSFALIQDDSTVYLDLPSRIKATTQFLQMEREMSMQNENVLNSSIPEENSLKDHFSNINELTDESVVQTKRKMSGQNERISIESALSSSTPEGNSVKDQASNANELIDDSKSLKLEQKYAESSPPESPTKSHHTDTYDENSSVLLGPFESNSIGSYHQHRPQEDLVDLPKEELLAFSSNFTEMNLETPSPLRDVNFLKEVPDIIPDDLQFDDLETISEIKPDTTELLPLPESNSSQDETDSQGVKEKAPLTPPNSPGVFLASAPQPKYLVEIDLNPPNPEEDANLSLQNEIELNQIELQITSKLAMAENENNMNIEYSGPLVEEGMEQDSLLMHDEDVLPERYLAGNLALDEECVQALRNELELKLPLAQVASIEPQPESEWCSELPPPPELIVNYPGALSPILEETRQQLSAYENDTQWNPATLPESSESYPEPCNNSTDEVTDLSVGNSGINENTFHIQSKSENNTYTVEKNLSSKNLTMSTDSLNGIPIKKDEETLSPIDDKTYTKKDDVTNCERISQVSPCLLSPSTDTTVPENSENATASSTFIKTFIPSDSKFNNTQCLSTATSIDSCCSNDTLYNVEENFDDLAMDPDIPLDFDKDEEFRERRHSYCSTYTIKDDKSDGCETFSPDSISENNYTYTNIARTDLPTATPSVDTKSDKSDKKSNDLAYGTLPSYSNCATEYLSGMEDAWKLPQPELIRKSPIKDDVLSTPPRITNVNDSCQERLEIKFEPCIKKMESLEITCLEDNMHSFSKSETVEPNSESIDLSKGLEHKSSTQFHTSTPLGTVENEIDEKVSESVSDICFAVTSPDDKDKTLLQSSDENIEDMSSIANIAFVNSNLLDEKKPNSISDTDKTFTYSDFEKSASTKPQQNVSTKETQSEESGVSSEDFLKFIRERPQDLSSGIDASFLLLANERNFALSSSGLDSIAMSQSDSLGTESTQPLVSIPPKNSNLNESQHTITTQSPDMFVTNLDAEEETDQPHSIIITDPKNFANETSNHTFDSHLNDKLLDTFNSHDYSKRLSGDFKEIAEETSKNNSGDLINEVIVFSSNVELNELPKNLVPNGSVKTENLLPEANCNGSPQVYATVNFLSDAFEELLESNVDGNDSKSIEVLPDQQTSKVSPSNNEVVDMSANERLADKENVVPNEVIGVSNSSKPIDSNIYTNGVPEKYVTESFLQNEKKFCQADSYLPLLSDIRFTGPASEVMSTSFNRDSPTEPKSPDSEKDKKSDAVNDLLKEWDSDSDNHSSNSSSGEFIWKDGDGRETAVVPSTLFQHQRDGTSTAADPSTLARAPLSSGSGDSGSGSEGDEEFVPSSWDCSAAPSKSSLRSLEQVAPNKKRVVFKRQKYHCVYEYPREVCEVESDSPAAYMPDLSTYCEWDPTTAEDAELGYSQLFGAPSPLDMFTLRSGIALGSDYDEDFFISSSARPFESLGIMSTSSQFFPGKHVKPALVERNIPDDVPEHYAPTLSPLTTLVQTRTPSLDFTTPDSGVEDITPGSMTSEEDYKKKLPVELTTWRPDSGSSSESVSPSSPASETLGGLRHTRDKLKLDLPPSPHIPSPRHNRVFNFVLDKPKRHRYSEETLTPPEVGTTPLVMTDETPCVTSISSNLPIQKETENVEIPEPTFSTFGKCVEKTTEAEQKCIVMNEVQQNTVEEAETKEENESHVKVETVKGEGTVLDSGDEDSGIESSKATLERNKTPNVL